MSQENIETVRMLIERWNEGDHSAPTEYLDPAVELETPFSSVSGEPYRGHSGIEVWIRDLDEQFSEWQLRLDDVREVGNTVIAVGTVHGRGRGSGLKFDQPAALVAEFGAEHRVVRGRIHLDVDAAFKAVGLPE